MNQLDADIERLQKAVRQGKGTEQSSNILAKSDLKRLLGNLEKQMLQKTKVRENELKLILKKIYYKIRPIL